MQVAGAPLRHILDARQFTREWLENVLFPSAAEVQLTPTARLSQPLTQKRLFYLFYEPSTRTRVSFEMAAMLLGGTVTGIDSVEHRAEDERRRLNELLSQMFTGRAIVDVQDPLLLDVEYVPQPDLALLRPRADYYASQTPTAADCLLVIEVADTSVELDRQIKMPRYARAGVAELWLVDLERDVVVVYQEPVDDSYQHVQVFRRSETISLGAERKTHVQVQSILG